MIGNNKHCLGSNANNAYIQVVDQENIKVMMDKCLSVNSALSTRDMAAKPDPGSSFTQKHTRIGSQY
jgi:hypothetical protein